MPTDYDAPRRTETDDVSEDSLEELKARRNEAASAVVDVDETESAVAVANEANEVWLWKAP